MDEINITGINALYYHHRDLKLFCYVNEHSFLVKHLKCEKIELLSCMFKSVSFESQLLWIQTPVADLKEGQT